MVRSFVQVASLGVLFVGISGCTGEWSRPTEPHALRAYAVLHAEMGSVEGNVEAARSFLESYEKERNPNDLLNLIRLYSMADTWSEGVQTLDEAAKLISRFRADVKPDQVPLDIVYLDGLVLRHSAGVGAASPAPEGGAPETRPQHIAVGRFREVTEKAPEVAAGWYQLGYALMEIKDFKGGYQALLQLVEIEPEHVAGHFKIFTCLTRLRRTKEAKTWLQKFHVLKAKTEGTPDRNNAKCKFTEIRLGPAIRGAAEPRELAMSWERVDLPAGIELPPLTGVMLTHFDAQRGVDVIALSDQGPRIFLSRGKKLVAATGLSGIESSSLADLLPADFNNDGIVDMLVLGARRVRIYRGEVAGDGKKVYAALGEAVQAEVAGGDVPGVEDPGVEESKGEKPEGEDPEGEEPGIELTAIDVQLTSAIWIDYDHDGDLDIVGLEPAPDETLAPIVLRNNGDETFLRIADLLGGSLEAGGFKTGARLQFAAADLDRGNDIDFVIPDATGGTRLLLNLREGPFRLETLDELGGASSLLCLDWDSDGEFDILAATEGGIVLARNQGARAPARLNAFRLEALEGAVELGRVHRLASGDLDNDGDLDVLIAAEKGLFLMRNRSGKLQGSISHLLGEGQKVSGCLDVQIADLDSDGGLDVAAVDTSGKLHVWRNTTSGRYDRLVLRLQGGRDNRKGVGSHIEIFRGKRYQRILVDGPEGVHVGLGKTKDERVEGLSILWPNGIRQPLLGGDLKPDEKGEMEVTQKIGLVVSCPFLYVFDGEEYLFHSDVVAIAPLDEWVPSGSKPHLDPEEYVRIPESMLRVKDGVLRLVITEELRECTYLDRVKLLRVTHPRGTVLVSDESTRQGAVEPLKVYLARATDLRPASRVASSDGRRGDVSVSEIDGRYFHPYREGLSQEAGWVKPFALDIDLPESWPHLYGQGAALLLTGRIAWQDSGVAYALNQHGKSWQPHRLEVRRADGSFAPGLADVGFPCGLDRTIVVPLDFCDERAAGLRLTATSRLFWDRISFVTRSASATLPDSGVLELSFGGDRLRLSVEPLPLVRADLQSRGYSQKIGNFEKHEQSYDFSRAGPYRSFPVPRGWATRFGDVRELVESPDDRLCVMPPGDALHLEFRGDVLASDTEATYFLLISGWAKESGFHNSTGRSIGPLPFRAMESYPPNSKNAPQSDAYLQYLATYQTRWVDGH